MNKRLAKKAAKHAEELKRQQEESQHQPMEASANAKGDIVDLILEDHKPLKKLIETMKNEEAEHEQKKAAFEQFAPLLIAHAKPEEEVLYTFMKSDDEVKEHAFEGDVEHGLADQMIEEIKQADDEDVWCAKVKVLAELVEHHIKEEEEEMLPDFKEHSNAEERADLGKDYLLAKSEFKASPEFKSSDRMRMPSEKASETQMHH